MEKQECLEATVCREIGARTGGEILIGVVGPVRTGKSTLLRQKAQHGVTVFLIAENDLLDRAAQLYIFFFVHKAPSSPAFSIPDT